MEISEGFGAIEIPQQSLHAPVAEARSPDPPFIQSPARQTINQTPPLSVCVCVCESHCMMLSLTNIRTLSAYFQLFSHCHLFRCLLPDPTPAAETIFGPGDAQNN